MRLIDYIRFQIPGKPVPKGRPRFNMKTGRIYTPKKTLDEELRIRTWFAENHYHQFIKYSDFKGPVKIELIYLLPFPSHLNKTEKIERCFHSIKPDIDNLVKLTIDSINKILFNDDSQIVEISAFKRCSYTPLTAMKIEYFE